MALPMKDANCMLEAGKEKQFINSFFTANSYTPDGIVGSGELMSRIKEAALVPKIPLPPFMHKLQNLMAGGIPLGTILTMGSMSGAGKSTISEEMVYYWVFNSPHKIGIVSLESDCAQYGTKILSRHISKKIDLIDDSQLKVNFLNTEDVQEKANELFRNNDGTHRFHLIDERDGGLDSLKSQIMELIVACDCRVIILDPLTDVLDGMSNEEQSVFMKWLKGMVKSHQVTFILISHVRKSSSGAKANSTGADLHEEDFMGSSSIFKSSACNLLFTRNKEHEDDILRNVTTMKMTKCRWTGRTAPIAGQFFYSNETHTLSDYEDWLLENPQEF
jgi:archaellum biogenesis ATPase FlaH